MLTVTLHTISFQSQAILVESSDSECDAKVVKEKTPSSKKPESPAESSTHEPSQREHRSGSRKSSTKSDDATDKTEKKTPTKPAAKEDKDKKTESKPKPKFHVNYEFFDPGNHWCRKCNVVSNNVQDVFQHLQKKQHVSVSEKFTSLPTTKEFLNARHELAQCEAPLVQSPECMSVYMYKSGFKQGGGGN